MHWAGGVWYRRRETRIELAARIRATGLAVRRPYAGRWSSGSERDGKFVPVHARVVCPVVPRLGSPSSLPAAAGSWSLVQRCFSGLVLDHEDGVIPAGARLDRGVQRIALPTPVHEESIQIASGLH